MLVLIGIQWANIVFVRIGSGNVWSYKTGPKLLVYKFVQFSRNHNNNNGKLYRVHSEGLFQSSENCSVVIVLSFLESISEMHGAGYST